MSLRYYLLPAVNRIYLPCIEVRFIAIVKIFPFSNFLPSPPTCISRHFLLLRSVSHCALPMKRFLAWQFCRFLSIRFCAINNLNFIIEQDKIICLCCQLLLLLFILLHILLSYNCGILNSFLWLFKLILSVNILERY